MTKDEKLKMVAEADEAKLRRIARLGIDCMEKLSGRVESAEAALQKLGCRVERTQQEHAGAVYSYVDADNLEFVNFVRDGAQA